MTKVLLGLFVSLAVLISPMTTVARTWRVEKDGSGDYSVIQDAVDVAASGDTIMIGPGRYDDKHLVTCPGWSEDVRVLVTQNELSIIGSGPETIIGQEIPWEQEQGNHMGIVASDFWGNKYIHIDKIHMENMRYAIFSAYEEGGMDEIAVYRCTFYGNRSSLTMSGDGGTAIISDCSFDHMAEGGIHLFGYNQNNISIQSCSFRLWDIHPAQQVHISLLVASNVNISDCDILEGSTGLSLTGCLQVTVNDCLYDGQSNAGLAPSGNTSVNITNCQFINQDTVVYANGPLARTHISDSVIEHVEDCAFQIFDVGSLDVHSCDLDKGERGVVWVQDGTECVSPVSLDMTDNYWGTDDPDSIAAWIRDFNDSDQACYIVDFEPFRDESTPMETKRLGDLKTLFR